MGADHIGTIPFLMPWLKQISAAHPKALSHRSDNFESVVAGHVEPTLALRKEGFSRSGLILTFHLYQL